MQSTSQKIKFFYTILLIGSINFFVHAQNTENNCITCGGPATEITNFIDLANQIIDTIPSNSTLQTQGAQYNIFGPRQGGVYNGILGNTNPGSLLGNIVAGTLKNFDKRQSYLRATSELLSIYSIDIIKDGGLGFIVSAQPWPIVRDYQLLLDIDTVIGDKLYEIGIAGGYGQKLPNQQLNEIKTLIKNNSGEGKLLIANPIINETLTATQSLALLLRINNRLKKTLVLGGQLSDHTITVGGGASTKIELNEKYLTSITERYKCTRIGSSGKSCSSSFAKFKKNIKNISKTFKEKGPKQSRDKIETASKRLATRALQITNQTDGNFYKENIKDYSQRESELLRTQGLTKRNNLGILTGALSSNTPRQLNNTRGNITGAREGIKNTTLSGINYFSQKTINTIISNDNYDSSALPESPQQMTISSTLNNIIYLHQETIDIQLQQTTLDTQEAISKTLFHIRLINNILNNNIKEDLARTCELQCSNLGGTCR